MTPGTAPAFSFDVDDITIVAPAVPADFDGMGLKMWLCSGVERGCFMTLPLGLYSLDRVYGRERRRTLRGGTSLPAPLDYDGDGDVDFTIFSGGPWHLYNDNQN